MESAQSRFGALEQAVTALNLGDGRPVAQTLIDVEAMVVSVQAKIKEIEDKMNTVSDLTDEKIKTAINVNGSKPRDDNQSFRKPILESKAISDLSKLTDAKMYRQWNRKAKNAIEQTRPNGRQVLEMLELITETDVTNASVRNPGSSKRDVITDIYLARFATKYPDLETSIEEINRDIWSILDAKSEGEALGKINSVAQ